MRTALMPIRIFSRYSEDRALSGYHGKGEVSVLHARTSFRLITDSVPSTAFSNKKLQLKTGCS
ncbi:MAG: hypothetical protein V8S69_03320 [Dakarella massiliensis]